MIRLNKLLAQAGVCARRKADALIASGDVAVDGRKAQLGDVVDPERQRITVRGKVVRAGTTAAETIVMNKPCGMVTTMRDERGRPAVADLLPKHRRFFPVGRLDADSSGVLLCTTDGSLARILTHPSFGVKKRYRVRARGAMTPATQKALNAQRIIHNPDGTYSFDIVLAEGKNRQVRRMCAQEGLRVVALTRLDFGPVHLGTLKPGKMRALTPAEKGALEAIRRSVESPKAKRASA